MAQNSEGGGDAPRVSVVIPAYNAEKFLAQAIQSVVDQSFKDFELIIVDDGSVDQTRTIAQSFDGVRYLYQTNSGVAAARNRGIEASTGEFVAFLDADDVWMREFLEGLVAVMDARLELGAAYAWARLVDERGALLPQSLCVHIERDVLAQLFRQGSFIVPSMLMVRREAVAKAGLFDPELPPAEDWDFLVRLAAAGVSFDCVPRFLVHKREYGSSLSANDENLFRASLRAVEKALALYLPERYTSLAAHKRAKIFFASSTAHWRGGLHDLAAERFLQGLEIRPDVICNPWFLRDLLSRLLPYAYHTEGEVLRNLEFLENQIVNFLGRVFAIARRRGAPVVRISMGWSTLHGVLAILACKRGRWLGCLSHGLRATTAHPFGLVRLAFLSNRGSMGTAYRFVFRRAVRHRSVLTSPEPF